MTDLLATQNALLERLCAGLATHSSPGLARIDTHISTLLLADEFAFKFKKPVDLGFVDYTTLAQRRQACSAEVRLNRRFAPQLYLGTVPVTVAPDGAPQLEGIGGTVVEWAVKMRRFDPDALLANRLDLLTRDLIESLARSVGAFHHRAAVCPVTAAYGDAHQVWAAVAQNFAQIRAHPSAHDACLDALDDWSRTRFDALQPRIAARKAQGAVRECHGDLHLGNIALIGGVAVPFDGIEFSAALRWIDRCSDLAFLSMDLTRIGRVDLARCLINAYLERSGDFDGLPLLRFYEVYRSLVRAKVAAIRRSQLPPSARDDRALRDEIGALLDTATALSRPGPRAIVITHGVAGSGKSTATGALLAQVPAIRVRSDVERKRGACVDPLALAAGRRQRYLYSPAMTARTYDRLAALATDIVAAGFVALVDATFLRQAERHRFAELAWRLDVPFVVLSCRAGTEVLRRRVAERQARGTDPSDADLDVLELQLATQEPLTAAERAHALVFEPERLPDAAEIIARIDGKYDR